MHELWMVVDLALAYGTFPLVVVREFVTLRVTIGVLYIFDNFLCS